MSMNTKTPATPARPAHSAEPAPTAAGEPSPDLARRRAAAEQIAQRIAAFKRVAAVPPQESPSADTPDAREPAAEPRQRPPEPVRETVRPAPNAARDERHPFVQAYAISKGAPRRPVSAPAAPQPRSFARPAPEQPRAESLLRPEAAEIGRPSQYGADFSALMRAKDAGKSEAARAEAAWAAADEARIDPARLDAARAEAIEARAARMEAARRRQAEAQEARLEEIRRDDLLREEAQPEDAPEAPPTLAASADEPRVDVAHADAAPVDELRAIEPPADELQLDEASADDLRHELQWAPIAISSPTPARRWPRVAAGLAGIVAIAAAATGATFIWQLRDSAPGSQPAILAASERAADELTDMLTPDPQPDVPSATVLAGSAAEPVPAAESAPELASISEPPSDAPTIETPASTASDSAPPEMEIVASAPSANHPPATRPGASRPATILSQLPDSEAIGDAPIVAPPTPDASGKAVTPQPFSPAPGVAASTRPKPQIVAKPKPAAEKATVVPAVANPVAQPASKPLSKPAKQTKATPAPVKEVLKLLAPMMNGSKPQQPEAGSRK